ncbi:MAG: hypothetical protein JXQ65_07680 [Candidatus Marinimicrobia bacterium]|nr:hypothetical protein [Candidatus Neomarinimicrobiota bacterium]
MKLKISKAQKKNLEQLRLTLGGDLEAMKFDRLLGGTDDCAGAACSAICHHSCANIGCHEHCEDLCGTVAMMTAPLPI